MVAPGVGLWTNLYAGFLRVPTGAQPLDLGSGVCREGDCLREIPGVELCAGGFHFKGPSATWASRWRLDRIEGP